jgi:hypothetical protein
MDEATNEPKKARKRAIPKPPPASPVEARDTRDPGDATQRNFRYQHAYGVMLMVGAKLGLRPYVAIWCEQHEDFLAERTDAKFDGYQVKTSRPENGAWRINDLAVRKAFGRFIDLVSEFGDSIGDLYFVSNTEPETVGPQNKDDNLRARCPVLFLEHVKSCETHADIAGVFQTSFLNMQADFGCAAERLFEVMRRVHFIVGPSRNEMDAVLCHDHLAKLDDCKNLSAEKLNQFRDQLVGKVYYASSLLVSDPIRHLRPVLSQKGLDPALAAKRLVVMDLIVYVEDLNPQKFQFIGDSQLRLGDARPAHVLQQKLDAGGLSEELDYMRERERSAERHLLEDVARRPERYPELQRQIEHVVLGECREAHLRARSREAPYGPVMMIDLQDRLKRIAKEETSLIGGHPYECLIGMAGLLTSECKVWWSQRFPITDKEEA